MSGIKAALDALFADAHLARDVVYTAEGGAPSLVRAILRRPDDVTGFGEARLWSETTRLDLRVAEVASPRPGDRIEIDGRHVRSRVPRAGRAVPGLLRDLDAAGITLDSIEVIRPTLDDVFLTITGRTAATTTN